MDVLSNFSKHDVLSLYVEIAKSDTNEDIQNTAIDYIGQLSKDKNRSIDALSELFSTIPAYRDEQLATVLSSIAEIGNDRAIDFPANIARTYQSYEL